VIKINKSGKNQKPFLAILLNTFIKSQLYFLLQFTRASFRNYFSKGKADLPEAEFPGEVQQPGVPAGPAPLHVQYLLTHKATNLRWYAQSNN
jgi:hypothetical protein